MPVSAMQRAIEAQTLPVVHRVDVNDPTLVLVGDGWSVGLFCPWQVRHAGQVLLDSEDEALDEEAPRAEVHQVVVHTLLQVAEVLDGPETGPRFLFDGEVEVVVDADTDTDPWTCRIGGHVFVGIRDWTTL